MKNTKTYKNNLGGFIKWSKDNTWNANFIKEYHCIGSGAEKIFVELSQNEFGGETACFTAVRYYEKEYETFINKYRENMSPELIKKVDLLTDLYAERMNATYVNYLI